MKQITAWVVVGFEDYAVPPQNTVGLLGAKWGLGVYGVVIVLDLPGWRRCLSRRQNGMQHLFATSMEMSDAR